MAAEGQPGAPPPEPPAEPAVNGDAVAEQHPLVLPSRPGRRLPVALLAAVGLGVAAYFLWSMLAPTEGTEPTAGGDAGVATDAVETDTAKPAAPESFRDCESCPEMLVVPGGSFLMGSTAEDPEATPEEQPQHRVTIAVPFAIGRTEVTFAEWLACVADGDCDDYRPKHEGWGGGPRPVINVSWHDAETYLHWLSRQTGKSYRLPTEAEWEYATRAGTTTRYWWGDDIGHDRANCKSCGSDWDEQQTAPVASFQANPFGLFDVHGNVWEWVEDCWQANYKAASPDGTPPKTTRGCGKRTLRGGSWDNSPEQLRSAARLWGQPDGRDNSIGFRAAMTLPTEDGSAEPPQQ
jgi:Uncharacterized conserved protein